MTWPWPLSDLDGDLHFHVLNLWLTCVQVTIWYKITNFWPFWPWPLTLICDLDLHFWPWHLPQMFCALNVATIYPQCEINGKKSNLGHFRSLWPWKFGHRSPIFELARDIPKMHLHTKFQDFPSLGSNARAMTEGQTDKRTDGTETITLPAKAGGNNTIMS